MTACFGGKGGLGDMGELNVTDPNDEGAYYADEDVDEIGNCMVGRAAMPYSHLAATMVVIVPKL